MGLANPNLTHLPECLMLTLSIEAPAAVALACTREERPTERQLPWPSSVRRAPLVRHSSAYVAMR